MFEKGRIGIFGDSLTELGPNVNDLSAPMIWSQMLKFKHPEYEFMVDAIGGRRLNGENKSMNGKARNGTDQLEPFIRNSFKCKKIVIFLGTNDIFNSTIGPGEGISSLDDLEKELFKFHKLLFKLIDELYQRDKPKVYFITTHKFNFVKKAAFDNEKMVTFKNYDQASLVFKKLKNVEIIDISHFESESDEGLHFNMDQQKALYKIIEKKLFEDMI